GLLMSTGFWDQFTLGVTSLPWYVVIILIFTAFFLVVLVHEIGHLFSFIRQGIHVKAFYVLCFVFVNIDGKWKFKLFPKFLALLGGMVAPILPAISNEEEETKVIAILKKALL